MSATLGDLSIRTSRLPPPGVMIQPPSPLAPSPSPTSWDVELNRRLRTLLRTAPLHRLEASKAQRTGDLSMHDLRCLALRAMDAVIEQMGLELGATRADVTDALAPLVRAAEPSADGARITELVDIVLDGLLNEAGRRSAFSEPYASVEGGAVVARELSFRLLREEEDPDGGVVLRVTAEGVNVYAGMLDFDVEDAQAAEEAVLQAQIRRGRIADAVATARRARMRSIEYEQKLHTILQSTRRDVAAVDWVDSVLGMLGDALAHLSERLDVERDLRRLVGQRLDGDPGVAATQLVELDDTLRSCVERHQRLHGVLLRANEQYLDQQQRQAFRPRALTPLPDLEAQVLRPALECTVGALEPQADVLLRTFQGPHVPGVFTLGQVVDRLLTPRRRSDEPELPDVEVELVATGASLRRFSDADHAAVSALLTLSGPAHLSDLLLQAESLPATVRTLLVLQVLDAWDQSDTDRPVDVESLDLSLEHPEFSGRDLLVRPRCTP